MFPAGAGMNRSAQVEYFTCVNVPRRRGDEPGFRDINLLLDNMFPAGAGMNRLAAQSPIIVQHVPRRRGDEPHHHPTSETCHGHVPRRRGDEPCILHLMNILI